METNKCYTCSPANCDLHSPMEMYPWRALYHHYLPQGHFSFSFSLTPLTFHYFKSQQPCQLGPSWPTELQYKSTSLRVCVHSFWDSTQTNGFLVSSIITTPSTCQCRLTFGALVHVFRWLEPGCYFGLAVAAYREGGCRRHRGLPSYRHALQQQRHPEVTPNNNQSMSDTRRGHLFCSKQRT